MAYLAFGEILAATTAARVADVTGEVGVGFTALEWSVIALAERDSIASLREPSRIAVAIYNVFGDRPNPRLADPRLEALRRIAVLGWRHGRDIEGQEVRDFVAAGFTRDHHDLLVDGISAARAQHNRKQSA
jgi:hypothetical protein